MEIGLHCLSRVVLIVGLASLAGCSNASVTSDSAVSSECVPGGDPFSTTTLRGIVSFLASDELAGRAPGTPGDEAARRYIEDRFRCLGVAPAETGGSYQYSFVNRDDETTANVVAVVPGGDPAAAVEIIVVGAHHDHLGVEDDEVYNGANDNASGVAALLAMAQAIQQRGQAPKRTIGFVAFGSEEEGAGGSEHFVERPPETLPIDNVVYMINLDMVGYSPNGRVKAGGAVQGTRARTDLAGLVSRSALQVELGAETDDDDQAAFCEAGIPFVYFAVDTDDDDCYHDTCDDIDRLDYEYLSAVAKLSFELLVILADSDADLLAERNEVGCDT